jgi:protease YdgD
MRGSLLHILVAALLLAASWAQAQAQSSGLDRLSRRGELLGWEAVGRIDLGRGMCTGVLIAPDLVLTAAHCVYDPRSGRVRQPEDITFRAGYRAGVSVAESGVLRVIAHEGYQPGRADKAANIRHDAALLQLSRTIPAMTAAPFGIYAGGAREGKVSVVSYGRGRAEAPSWQRSCALLGRSDGLMAFDCDVTFGSSGAPVFMKEGNRARILSLVSAGTMEGDRKLSYGMELGAVVADLKRQLRALPSRSLTGTASSGARRITVGSGRSGSGAKFVRPGD